MRTLNRTLYYPSRTNILKLYHITDVHIGHRGCDEKLLKDTVSKIEDDEFAFWGGGGDMCDFIPRKGDKRYREETLAQWLHGLDDVPKREEERFLEIVRPIASKCLYLLKGNHEDTIKSYYDNDPFRHIAKQIAEWAGCEVATLALGWEGFIKLHFRRGNPQSYGSGWGITIYTHHGAGGGRKAGGHALRLEELMLTYGADIVLSGHRHIYQAVRKPVVIPSGKGSRLITRLGVFCPGLLRSYLDADDEGMPRDNYAQIKNLPPVDVGVMHLDIIPDKKRIELPITIGG